MKETVCSEAHDREVMVMNCHGHLGEGLWSLQAYSGLGRRPVTILPILDLTVERIVQVIPKTREGDRVR